MWSAARSAKISMILCMPERVSGGVAKFQGFCDGWNKWEEQFPDDPITLVARAELHDQSLHCLLPIDRIVAIRERLEPHDGSSRDPVDARLARLHLPLVRRRGETWVLKGPSAGHMPDPVLVKALRSAHAMLHQDDGGLPVLVTAPDTPYRRRLVRLAFLAPEIQRAIVEGRQSAGVTLTQLLKGPIPLAWSQQAVQIGIATPPE